MYSIELKLKKFKVGFDGGKIFSIVLFETDEARALLVTFSTTLSKLKKAL